MAGQRLKVLFLASWYPSRLHAVNGIFIQRHAEAVSKLCDVAVLYVDADPGMNRQTYQVEQDSVGSIFTVRVFYKTPKWGNIVRYLRGGWAGYRIIEKKFGRPDVIHVNVALPAGMLALLLKWGKRLRYLVSEHWSGYTELDGSYRGIKRKLYTQLVVRGAELVTAVTTDLRDAMLSHRLPNRYEVVANVVDTELFYPGLDPGRTTKRIIHVSLLIDAVKNVSGILRAVAAIAQERQDFELLILGDGEDRNRLQRYAAELKIKDRWVFFRGMQPGSAVAQIMRNSDFLLLFSNYENFPCVIAEAMASALPIVATRVGGIPEHVSDQRGILVFPGDEEALKEAVRYMLNHHATFAKNGIREYALRHFSYPAVGQRLVDLYLGMPR